MQEDLNNNCIDENLKRVVINPKDKQGAFAPDSVSLSIDMSKFENEESTVTTDNETKKYNIKIKKQDLVLIDEIANLEGASRTEIINKLISSYLVKTLLTIKEEGEPEEQNIKLRLLIASRADALTDKSLNTGETSFKYDPFGWCGLVAKGETIAAIKHASKYGFFDLSYDPSSTSDLTPEKFVEQNQTDVYKKIKKILLEV